MRKPNLSSVLAALAAAAATAAAGVASSDHHRREHRAPKRYSIGLWGDLPYSQLQKTSGVPNIVADMNRHNLAFVADDGDLKSRASPCTDDVYLAFKATLNSLEAPAIFTPGDNDWIDCEPQAGVSSSAERLAFERKVFFRTSYSLGQRRLRLHVQDAPYVENRRWSVRGVTYATLNVPGSCDNLCGTTPDAAEHAARTTANLAWLHAAFAHARQRRSAAVMIVWQADPGFDGSDATRAPTRDPRTLAQTDRQPDGYRDLLLALRDETAAFRRPVALVHGDSHYLRIDKPLQDAGGRRLENFTRVETFGDHQDNGDNDAHWLKVDVDPRSREVFSFQPQIVPANRTAVPAP